MNIPKIAKINIQTIAASQRIEIAHLITHTSSYCRRIDVELENDLQIFSIVPALIDSKGTSHCCGVIENPRKIVYYDFSAKFTGEASICYLRYFD